MDPRYESNDVETEDKALGDDICQIKEDVAYLRDLFVRRLNDDKQKGVLINALKECSEYAFIEPFLHDLILLLDRLEKADDEFSISVRDELYDIINRRGVSRIEITSEFDPAYYKAVKVVENPMADKPKVVGVIRNGYIFSGKVIRPAEVVVEKP